MGEGAGLGVGHVLERVRGARVAQRPDPFGRRPAVLVDLDPPVLPQPDPGPVQVQVGGVRGAAGRHQQQLARDRRAVLELHLDLAAALARAGDLGRQAKVPALAGQLGEPAGDLGIEGLEQGSGLVDDADADAKGGEQMSELDRDIAAAHDDHAGRQPVKAHHRVRGVIADPGLGDGRRDHRAGPGGQHDPVGGDPGAVIDGQLVRAGEAGPAFDQRHRVRLRPVATALGGDTVGLVERPVPDGGPVHAGERGLDPEFGCAADLIGDIGGVQEDLAGDAAAVDAGASEGAGLDQRDRALRRVFGTTTLPEPEPMMTSEK